MKKINLFILFLSLIACAGTIKAELIDGVNYNLDVGNHAATVTYGTAYSGDIVIPESVVYSSVSYTVTEIGNDAFYNCSSLTSVSIPNTITSISSQAFRGCSGLTSFSIPNSVTVIGPSAFSGCSGLTSVTIGNSVQYISDFAFQNCSSLTSVTIPGSVTQILRAFSGCTGVTDVYCYPLAANLTWEDGNADFKTDGSTRCYVQASQLSAYKAKFNSTVNVTFVGITDISANEDPATSGVYYSTFFDSSTKYALPAGVEAYVATVSSDALNLTRIAGEGDVIPADNAVILKSSVNSYLLTVSEEEPVSFSVTNNLQGTDESTAAPANCYVLSAADNIVGFYRYTAASLNPHKAYVVFGGAGAPKRLRFVFDAEQTATGVESVESQNQHTDSRKLIENGNLYIIRDGVRYNTQGQSLR